MSKPLPTLFLHSAYRRVGKLINNTKCQQGASLSITASSRVCVWCGRSVRGRCSFDFSEVKIVKCVHLVLGSSQPPR